MNRTMACRRLARAVVIPCSGPSLAPVSTFPQLLPSTRPLFTTGARLSESSRKLSESLQAMGSASKPGGDGTNTMGDLSQLLMQQITEAAAQSSGGDATDLAPPSGTSGAAGSSRPAPLATPTLWSLPTMPTRATVRSVMRLEHERLVSEPYHLHMYSKRHNNHMAFTKPNGEVMLKMSGGHLGFKHAKRGTYDSAFQLASVVVAKLTEDGWHRKMHGLEIVLSGFGPGREAFLKVLLGSEGKLLRTKIVKVSDATKLKFGGGRSRKPKRLG